MESTEFKQEVEAIYNKEKGLSFSSLRAFMKSPKHFYKYKTDKETTEAMEQGKRFHMAILEPEKYTEKYWVLDDTEKYNELIAAGAKSPRSMAIYKEWKAEQEALNAGKELIKKDEHEIYMSMKEFLYKCEASKNLMNGLKHKEKRFNYEWDGFLINGIIDGVGSDYTLDLKKVADADFNRIRWNITDKDHLDMQGAIYAHNEDVKQHFLIFIDSGCNITVVRIGKDKLSEGFSKFCTAIDRFKACCEEDKFYYSYEFNYGKYINL